MWLLLPLLLLLLPLLLLLLLLLRLLLRWGLPRRGRARRLG